MKIGDLVEWHTNAWAFKSAADNYANPGIVLKVKNNSETGKFVSAKVYWADGRVTSEHACYLRSFSEKSENNT